MTKPGRQWIHADADYYRDPLTLQIRARFGWAGVIFFDAFLRACKRSVPQGQVIYLTEDELVHFLGVADLPRVNDKDDLWTIHDLWRFLGSRRPAVVRSRRAHGRVTVTSCGWDAWETSASSASHAEQMRRSRAQKRDTRAPGSMEVGGGRLEVGGGSVRGESAGPAPASSQGADAAPASKNGAGRPDPAALVALVESIEAQAGDLPEQP